MMKRYFNFIAELISQARDLKNQKLLSQFLPANKINYQNYYVIQFLRSFFKKLNSFTKIIDLQSLCIPQTSIED